MIKKVVVASDSFKGSLTSAEVAEAAGRGIRTVFPDCEVVEVPVADGGEGTMRAVVSATGGRIVRCRTCDPLSRLVDTEYGVLPDGVTAVVELASSSGLPLLSPSERDPLRTTTYGTGELIANALRRGYRRFLLALGGSATNDGGTGLLRALGFRFLDGNGREIADGGAGLLRLERIDRRHAMPELAEAVFRVACDVTSPLYGPTGAAVVFAPQKGAGEEAVRLLDDGLRRFASVLGREGRGDVALRPGAGAAGGTGAGLMALLGAELLPGTELVLDTIGFSRLLDGADLVVTGEGRIDLQTTAGKAPAGIAAAARKKGIPAIAIAGSVEHAAGPGETGLEACFCVLPSVQTLEEAMDADVARANVTQCVTQIFRLLKLARERIP